MAWTSRDYAEDRGEDAAAASKTIGRLWFWGLLLLIGGAALAATAWPSTEPAPDRFTPAEESGDMGLAIVGLLAAGIGQVTVLVAVVATGAGLAIRATRDG